MPSSIGSPSATPAVPLEAGTLALLEAARQTPCTRAGIEALARRVPDDPGAVQDAIRAAAERFEGAAGALLALAAAEEGLPLDADDIWPLLSIVPDIHWVPLVLSKANFHLLTAVLRAIDSGRLSTEREALAILIAVEALGGEKVPPAILARLQVLARKAGSRAAGDAIGLAARSLKDPLTRQACARWIAIAALQTGRQMLSGVRALMSEALPEVLPTRHDGARVGEAPVVRADTHTGRNDPCPCGSGQKFKRCCMQNPDAARTVAPRAPVAAELDRISSTRTEDMSAYQMAKLDFAKLSTRSLIDVIRSLSRFQYWERAEAAMEVLQGRGDLPLQSSPDEYREDLLADAVDARAVDVVRRQVPKLRDETMLEHTRIGRALLEPAAGTLAVLEERARAGLAGDKPVLIDLAFALLCHFPALGVLAGRAALDPEHTLDSETVLADIEDARARLQLPPGDRAIDVFELLLEDASRGSDGHPGLPAGRASAAEESSSELRGQLRDSGRRVVELERQLRATQAQLAAPEPRQDGRSSLPDDPERRDLRDKIAEMKSLIGAGQLERAELCRELAKSLAVSARPAASPESPDPDSEDEPGEIDGETPSRHRLSIPVFSERASAALTEAPPALAARALRLAAELAAGDAPAWSGVKRLQGVDGVWSARVGIHHRLIFRLAPDRNALEVAAFINRKDLGTTLKQIG